MALVHEGNEIQDSEILTKTLVKSGTNDMIQFAFPAEGEPLVTSEWFNVADRRKALMPWMGAVRTALIEQAEKLETARKERALATRKIQTAAAPRIVPSSGEPPVIRTESSDPLKYALAQLATAREQARYWGEIAKDSSCRVDEALERVVQWRTIVEALGGNESDAHLSRSGGADNHGGNGGSDGSSPEAAQAVPAAEGVHSIDDRDSSWGAG